MRGRGRDRALARRFKNARRLAIELAALENYLAQNLFSWMRADYRTEAGGKVTAFQDKVADGVGARAIDPAHAFVQGNASLQVNAPATSVPFAGRDAVIFAGGPYYDSSIVAANWNFASNGVGVQCFVTLRRTSSNVGIIATTGAPSTRFQLDINVSAGQVRLLPITGPSTSAGALSTSASLLEASYIEGGSPEAEIRINGASAASISMSPLGTAAITMRVGASSAGTFPMEAEIADIMFANRVDVALRTSVQRYALLRYGMAA